MVSFEEIDVLSKNIFDLYAAFEESVIRDIVKRLISLGKIDSISAWRMQRLVESAALYKDVLGKIAKLSGISEKELEKLFKTAGVRSLKFTTDAFSEKFGKVKRPTWRPVTRSVKGGSTLYMTDQMWNVLHAGIRKTNGVLKNLTLTTAAFANQAFISASDLAYLQVTSGAFSYQEAMDQAILSVAKKGIQVINYKSGHRDQLDVAVRRTLLTGVGQTVGNMQLQLANEMGTDLVEISAHIGARNVGEGPKNHESWQGKVYSLSGSNTEYGNFLEITGYGTAEGLHGVNCRHHFFPFFEGFSIRSYTDEELQKMADIRVKYQGEEMSVYEASQKQRYMERQVRYWKRQEAGLKEAERDHFSQTEKVKEWQGNLREFIKETGLDRQYERENIQIVPELKVLKPEEIDFRSKESQMVGYLGDKRDLYSEEDPGRKYLVDHPVIYNHFAVNHLLSDSVHQSRLGWIEENADDFVRAIHDPEIIEKKLRMRKDGYYSATHIVKVCNTLDHEWEYMSVAISISNEITSGYNQITTIHPNKKRDLFLADGELKNKYKVIN